MTANPPPEPRRRWSRRGQDRVRISAPVLVAMTDTERDTAIVALARLLADLATTTADPQPHPRGDDDPDGDWPSCDRSS